MIDKNYFKYFNVNKERRNQSKMIRYFRIEREFEIFIKY